MWMLRYIFHQSKSEVGADSRLCLRDLGQSTRLPQLFNLQKKPGQGCARGTSVKFHQKYHFKIISNLCSLSVLYTMVTDNKVLTKPRRFPVTRRCGWYFQLCIASRYRPEVTEIFQRNYSTSPGSYFIFSRLYNYFYYMHVTKTETRSIEFWSILIVLQ